MIKLLWTGGRDSTYRLCQLLLVEKTEVQPYYIISSDRTSTKNELNAMKQIQQMLMDKNPDVISLLKPTTITLGSEIQPNKELKNHWFKLYLEHNIGSQYGLLARFADQNQYYDLELCLTNNIDRPLNGLIIPNIIGTGHEARIKEQPSNPHLIMFRYFRFPVIHLSKKDMDDEARKQGFHDIMDETWSCFTPIDNQPCGVCEPCLSQKKYGLFKP